MSAMILESFNRIDCAFRAVFIRCTQMHVLLKAWRCLWWTICDTIALPTNALPNCKERWFENSFEFWSKFGPSGYANKLWNIWFITDISPAYTSKRPILIQVLLPSNVYTKSSDAYTQKKRVSKQHPYMYWQIWYITGLVALSWPQEVGLHPANAYWMEVVPEWVYAFY